METEPKHACEAKGINESRHIPVEFENCCNGKDPDKRSPIQVVLVYDDFDMAVHGKRIFDLIAKVLGVEEQVGLSVWRFDLLLSLDLVRAAVQQAEQADVVIIASRKRSALPVQIKNWLEQWPPRRKAAYGALVAVFDPAVGHDTATSEAALELHGVAARAGMDFFCGALDAKGMPAVAAETPPVDTGEVAKTMVNTTATATTASPARMTANPHFCSRGWGIND